MKTTPNEIMLDIETMGTRPTSAIIAIGAAAFNFESGEQDTFYCEVMLLDCLNKGCTQDKSTVDWWNKQSDEARKILTSEDALPLSVALEQFTRWIVKIRREAHKMELGIWGNDNTFDLVITEHAFERCNKAVPWNYWESRSVRTLVNIGERLGINPKKNMKRGGVHHNAVDDSIFQVKYCKEIMRRIKLP